jgi:hypothetical protein
MPSRLVHHDHDRSGPGHSYPTWSLFTRQSSTLVKYLRRQYCEKGAPQTKIERHIEKPKLKSRAIHIILFFRLENSPRSFFFWLPPTGRQVLFCVRLSVYWYCVILTSSCQTFRVYSRVSGLRFDSLEWLF